MGAIATKNSGHTFRLAKKIQSAQAGLDRAQERPMPAIAIFLLRLPFLLLALECAAGVALASIFVVSTIAGAAAGYSPPTTTIFRWFAWARLVGSYDQYGQQLVLLTSTLCAVAAAVARLLGSGAVDEPSRALVRFLSRWGFPVIAALFMFTISGIWAGLVRIQDFDYASIGGMVPFSDAASYAAAAFDAPDGGAWNAMALRRPLAAAFREILTLGGGLSYADALLLQATIAALATWLAARAVAKWAGAAAGFAFLCLAYAIQRSFLSTTLTEPLGLIWALFAIPFFVLALRFQSLAAAHTALGLTVVSLLTRMGAMFLVPALIVWIALYFGKTFWQKCRNLAVCIAIIAAGACVNQLLTKTQETAADLTGSNFAYVLCGLSIAENWSVCPQKYADELSRVPPGEKAHTDFFYSKAISNIRHYPTVILLRLARGGLGFLSRIPVTVTQGYMRPTPSVIFSPNVFVVVATCGLAAAAWLYWSSREAIFWLLVMGSITASSAFVYFDDGLRVMTASYPLIALFWTRGLQQPADHSAPPSERKLSYGGILIGVVLVVCVLVIPASAPRLINWLGSPPLFTAAADQNYIYGGRRMSGFVIVADNEQPLKGAPSMTLSNFQAVVKASGVESYQGLVENDPPPTPFAFIYAPRAERHAQSNYSYIVPPEVFLNKSVPFWRLTVREWQRKPDMGLYWYLAERAEPIGGRDSVARPNE